MSNPITLSIGEAFHLGGGKDRIRYAGMPSENSYSIVQRKGWGNQAWAWNLFYPIKQRDITIDGVDIIVESVSPNEIRFRIK